MNELALFAGAGGGILGGKLLGWRTVCAVEIDAYCRKVLFARQRDGILEPFPIWDDVKTFDGNPWRGKVDVISGGFPCQDISAAGKGVGITGERSGLWKEYARILGEVRPRFAFIENSPMLLIRGLERVLCDLAGMGFDAEWCVLGADDCGAPQERKRLWILSYARGFRPQDELCEHEISNAKENNRETTWDMRFLDSSKWGPWKSEYGLDRVVNGVAGGVDRCKAIGNGQVPIVAATAWNILLERIATPKEKKAT